MTPVVRAPIMALEAWSSGSALEFTVHGNASPAGSKVAFRTHQGRMLVRDAAKGSAPWKRQVADEGARAMLGQSLTQDGTLVDGPLGVKFVFVVPRPRGHYGARGLKPSAPEYPTVRPDVLKLARAVEDALTGVVWRDDAQIVYESLFKCYGEPARVEILVWRMLVR